MTPVSVMFPADAYVVIIFRHLFGRLKRAAPTHCRVARSPPEKPRQRGDVLFMRFRWCRASADVNVQARLITEMACRVQACSFLLATTGACKTAIPALVKHHSLPQARSDIFSSIRMPRLECNRMMTNSVISFFITTSCRQKAPLQ